jgi:integral membrane protein (TIGR00529 family)
LGYAAFLILLQDNQFVNLRGWPNTVNPFFYFVNEFLAMEFSAVAKILIVFFGVLAASRVRIPLGVGLIIGGLTLDLWAGKNTQAIAADLWQALMRPELWLLAITITLIMEVGHFMASDENGKAIIALARRYGGKHGQAASLILIPAAIGLVPMPGGALFSAPLVGRSAQNSSSPPEWKAAVNYWFRHILEYWWPLYPVVIVTLSIFTLQTWKFMLLQIPFTFVSLGAGYFFLLRRQIFSFHTDIPVEQNLPSIVQVLLPIIIIVLATLLLPEFFHTILPGLNPASWKLLSMLAGLITSLVIIWRGRKNHSRKMFSDLATFKSLNVFTTLAGVVIFESLLNLSGLIPLAGRELSTARVPVELIIAFLPFLAGLVTGIAIGFAGAAFPIVVGFMATGDISMQPMAALVLAFSMGYAGMMLSPVHLCFLLTVDYFSASFIKVYRYILPCVLAIMTFGVMLYLILQTLVGI